MFVPSLPANNPCAQCGKPIARPSWTEATDGYKIHFIWDCAKCGYSYQTTAVYGVFKAEAVPIAA